MLKVQFRFPGKTIFVARPDGGYDTTEWRDHHTLPADRARECAAGLPRFLGIPEGDVRLVNAD